MTDWRPVKGVSCPGPLALWNRFEAYCDSVLDRWIDVNWVSYSRDKFG